MSEKVALAVLAALAGGAFNSVMEGMQTKGELRAIQAAIVRIEARLYAADPPAKPKDRN